MRESVHNARRTIVVESIGSILWGVVERIPVRRRVADHDRGIPLLPERPIVLPYTGAYTIRVEGASDRSVSGVYRFKVVLQ